MNYGFFTLTELNPKRKQLSHSPHCGACGLYKNCHSPKMSYKGEGRKKILVIGESPGADEDDKGEQFVGKAGKRLQYELKRNKINLNIDCWKTNARRCYVEGNPPPTKEIKYCRPALIAEIKKLQPVSILLFGASAVESVIGYLWKDDEKFALNRWVDWNIPSQEWNCWISVHYHPSYLERSNDDLLNLIARKQLKSALVKTKRPWKTIPDYASNIEIIYKPSQAAKAIRDLKPTFAFDYETNCLKPEYEGAEIVSCSMSDGERTIAYPWAGEAIEQTSEWLKSPLRKIAANMKFEERWTRYFLKHGVRNWHWDTMLAAHVLNNAPGITGLKFQSFVRLGLKPYDIHIEPYLKPKGRNEKLNRIRELPIKDVLEYNGMDSYLEHKIAGIQKLEFEGRWLKK